MYEQRQILIQLQRLRASHQPLAIATVVKIDGSTYRRPGARMLIDAQGHSWGTISGGCLEGEVAQRAVEAMPDGGASLHPFELGEDDVILGFGTGCDGIVHVLIEAYPDPDIATPLDAIAACEGARARGVMATVLQGSGRCDGAVGQRLVVADAPVMAHATLIETALAERVAGDARRIAAESADGAHRFTWQNRRYADGDDQAEVLFERIEPPIRLVIFGDGHDVRPVVAIARRMGWDVWIAGRKPVETLADRFPDADRHLFLMHPEEVAAHVPIDARTAVFVMNHNYMRDRSLLAGLLATPAPYIGLLGPRHRTERMLEELAPVSGDDLSRVHGPMGLDIGTETPEEIALAALGEAQAAMHRRTGGPLRHRQGPIHEIADAA